MTFNKPSSQTNISGYYGNRQTLGSPASTYIDNNFVNILDKTGDTVKGNITIPGQVFLLGSVNYTIDILNVPSDTSSFSYTLDGYNIKDALVYINTANTPTSTATIYLPDATKFTGRMITIKDTGGNASVQHILLTTTIGQGIDGSLMKTISTNYDGYTVASDGSNWFITMTGI